MKTTNGVMAAVTSVKSLANVRAIAHLPLLSRLANRKARRTLAGFTIGTGLLFVASAIAADSKALSEISGVSHLVFHALGNLLHGFAAVPIARHVDPLWVLIIGEAKEVA